eukprot:1146483-Pelagomonas_calceolata.AAC.6
MVSLVLHDTGVRQVAHMMMKSLWMLSWISCGSILRIPFTMPSGPGDLLLLSDYMRSLNALLSRILECSQSLCLLPCSSSFVIWDWRLKGSGTGSDFPDCSQGAHGFCVVFFNNLGLPTSSRFTYNSVGSRVTKGLILVDNLVELFASNVASFFIARFIYVTHGSFCVAGRLSNLLKEREVRVHVFKPYDGFAEGCVLLGFQLGLDSFNDAELFPQCAPLIAYGSWIVVVVSVLSFTVCLAVLSFRFWRKAVALHGLGPGVGESLQVPGSLHVQSPAAIVCREDRDVDFKNTSRYAYHKGDMVAEGAQFWGVARRAQLSKFCREDKVTYAAERVFSAIANVLAGCLAVSLWSGGSLFARERLLELRKLRYALSAG